MSGGGRGGGGRGGGVGGFAAPNRGGGGGVGGNRQVPQWLQPGTMLGDANAKLLQSCPEQISSVAPPIVIVGVVGAFVLGGPQIAVMLALVYFFTSQQTNPAQNQAGQQPR